MIDFLQTQLLPIGLSNAAIATILSVAVLLATWKSKLPLWTHALWVLVLIKLVTPPLFWIHALLPSVDATSNPIAMVDVLPAEPIQHGMSLEISEQGASMAAATGIAAEAEPPVAVDAVSAVTIPWLQLIACAWFFGCLITALRIAVAWVRFGRWMRQGEPAPREIENQLSAVARDMGLRKIPSVKIVKGKIAPSVYSLAGRSTLLLPAGLLDQLSSEEMETVIAHELAHLRRRDHWVRVLEVAARVTFWWHPVVSIAQRKIHQAADEACDLIVQTRMPHAMRSYASAMLKTVDFLAADETDASDWRGNRPLVMGMGDIDSLSRRMRQISRVVPQSNRAWLRRGAIVCLAFAMLPLGILTLPQTAQAQQSTAPVEPPKTPPQPTPPPPVKPSPAAADPFSADPFAKPRANPGNHPAKPRPVAADPFSAKPGNNLAKPRPAAADTGEPDAIAKRKEDALKRRKVEGFLREALSGNVNFDAIDVPLQVAVKQLSDQSDAPILIDIVALEEIGLTPDLPVTLSLKNVSLRSTLRLMCRKFGLTYMIKDDVIQVTTPEVAEGNLTVQAYSLPSVLATRSDKVIKALTTSVQPDTWEQLGGPSSVSAIDNVLVVSATESVHAQVQDFIAKVEAAFERRKKLEAEK